MMRLPNPTIREIPASSLRHPDQVDDLFRRYEGFFRRYPDLWVKGGGARATFLDWAKRNFDADSYRRVPRIRDVDLIYFGEILPDEVRDLEDVGYDVERLSSMHRYWHSRDVGINEVLLRPEKLLFSEKAIRDFHRGELHPSGNVYNVYWEDIPYRVGVRGVLFAIENDLQPSRLIIESAKQASPFNVLLGLYKAYMSGKEGLFFATMQAMGNFTARRFTSPEQALLALTGELDFELRSPENEGIYEFALSEYQKDRWLDHIEEWENA